MQARPAVLAVPLILSALWSNAAMSEQPATQIRSFRLNASPERVMPLFTAEGELFSANPALINEVELRLCRPLGDIRHSRRVLVRSSGEISSRRIGPNDTGC